MLRNYIKKLLQRNTSVYENVGKVFVLVLIIILASTNISYAIENPFNLTTLITDALANFFYSMQTIASWLIYLAGALLNFSVNLTLHIKEFVNSTPAIYTVWKAIRDISGMFIIFALLYAAIRMILGRDAKLGDLIKNIVVAGVLINFSFFLTGLAIDVSNVVSIQLYNAIAPAQELNIAADSRTGILGSYLDSSSADGGLSTIFMQSLGVTRLYNPAGGLSASGQAVANTAGSSGWTAPLKIILISITSIIIMITAAISFFLAALAFIVRFVLLLFFLAFSPIVFASYVVPEIGKYATKWTDNLKSQLIFMPVYLILMYFALSVLTTSSIFKNGYAGALTSSGGFMGDLMVLAVNAVLVIVMLNAPLVGAMSVMTYVPKWAEGLKGGAIWKKFGGSAGRNTLGAAASGLHNSRVARALYASEPNLGLMVSKGLSKVSGASFGGSKGGYDAALKKRKKDLEGLDKHIGENKVYGAKYQESFRSNLNKRSVFTMLMKDRASTEVATKLIDKAAKKAKKDSKKTVIDNRNKAQTALRELEDKIAENSREIGLRPGTPPTIAEIEEVKRLKGEVDKYNKELDEIREIEESDRDDKLAEKVAERTKKEDDGGGEKKSKDKDKSEDK